MNNKYRIRKTGEIVEVISYGGSTTRSDVLDFVSYIDSKGVEHEKEPLNLYWDLSPIKKWGVENKQNRNLSQETANCDKQFDKILEMNTEAERRKIATQAMVAILSNPVTAKCVMVPNVLDISVLTLAKLSVKVADALIAELNKKKDDGSSNN